ncbi:MAG: hypothetical protein NZ739_08595 [Verrucomicrobiae bacterium]|nr:hypothetical protein [Verrucomicrobiae bacterium]
MVRCQFPVCLGLVLCLIAPLLAISDASLWIDEALTAVKAQQPTLSDWWRAMVQERASDLQMPLYMLYMWGYEKVFGSDEWVLRAANAPLFVAGAICFLRRIARLGTGGMAFAVAVALSPFAWAYLNEARPYAMAMAAGLVVYSALVQLLEEGAEPSRNCVGAVALFSIGGFILSGSSLLGMVWFTAALVGTAWALPAQKMKWLARQAGVWIWITLVWLGALGLYYVWTVLVGARGTAVGGTAWKNVVFVFYELLGFAGLGPGRLEIRASGFDAFRAHLLPLGIYAVLVGVVAIEGIRSVLGSALKREVAKVCVCLAIAGAALFCLGWAVHWRVLGRHFAPIWVPVGVVLGLGMQRLWSRGAPVLRAIVVAFVVLMAVSCAQLRFSARHARDDYRQAAFAAKSALAHGKVVWWNADPSGAKYYGLPDAPEPGGTVRLVYLANPTSEDLARMVAPDVIIASRPDVYDNQGAVARYVSSAGFELVQKWPGFIVWRAIPPRDRAAPAGRGAQHY